MQRPQPIARALHYLERPAALAPLAMFRVLFGALLFVSVLRFLYLGWVEDQYLSTQVQFHYFGFAWVRPLPAWGMYGLYTLMGLAALGIMLGLWYRASATVFFLSFTYVELIDLTYYLNHYYFVSLMAGLMIVLPAHRYFALDALRQPHTQRTHTRQWVIGLVRLQVALVYVYAGLAKINSDWLLHALPLKIWLPANSHMPLLGTLFNYEATAFAFSWAGMLYDCTIPALLLWRPTRPFAYLAVVGFHAMTGWLFQIGMFPYIMTAAALIFFPASFHKKVIAWLQGAGHFIWQHIRKHVQRNRKALHTAAASTSFSTNSPTGLKKTAPWKLSLLALFIAFQLLWPWRYLLYPGNLFWTEEGYRFSWRVMLVEKAGTATFFVKDGATGREGVVDNSEFLNRHQEKQMSYQPDMILQYAHWLARHYARQGMQTPEVRAEVWATLNGRPSQLLIDPKVNLAAEKDGWAPKHWILPYNGTPGGEATYTITQNRPH